MHQSTAGTIFDPGEGVSEGFAFRSIGEEHGDGRIGYLGSEEGFDGIWLPGVNEQIGTVSFVQVMNDVVEGCEQGNIV